MREYQTTGIIRVNGGYIGLDKRQAGARRSRVKPTKEAGVYEILAPVQFKAGEKIRKDNPDKVTLARLDMIGKSEAVPAEKMPAAEKPAPAVKAKPAAKKPVKKK